MEAQEQTAAVAVRQTTALVTTQSATLPPATTTATGAVDRSASRAVPPTVTARQTDRCAQTTAACAPATPTVLWAGYVRTAPVSRDAELILLVLDGTSRVLAVLTVTTKSVKQDVWQASTAQPQQTFVTSLSMTTVTSASTINV